MNNEIKDCPCSGKSSSNFAAPWILLTLYRNEGMHGYALAELIGERLEALGAGLNRTGVYRHLSALETREMLVSELDKTGRGASRRKYRLTESGLSCLRSWLRTLHSQALIIDAFFKEAEETLPADFFLSGDGY